MRATDDKTLTEAMRILARNVQSADGLANSAIGEAAGRIEALSQATGAIRAEVAELIETLQKARVAVGLTKPNEAVKALTRVLAIIDRHDARVFKPCD